MKNFIKQIIFLAIFFVFSSNLNFIHSQDTDKLQGLDEYIQQAMKDWNVQGISVAIVKNGQVILSKGYGYRDTDKKLPVTSQTLFEIGSSTKAFTATAVCMLDDEGKIDLDKPVINYMPTFKMWDDYVTLNMTPRDLLTHRSGLPRHDLVWYGTDKTRKELVEALRYLEPSKPFRTTFQYQNMMFMTAGYLVEQVSGKTWEDFVKERIFTPLEMNNSNFSVTVMQASNDYSTGYNEEKDGSVKVIPYRPADAVGPAGTINSCSDDMAKWLVFQLGNGNYNGKQLLSESKIREMHTPFITVPSQPSGDVFYSSYGLGWFITNYRGHTRVEHGGNIDGFSASVCLMPYDSIGIVVLSNMNNSSIPSVVRNTAIDMLLGLESRDWNKKLLTDLKKAKDAAKDLENKEDPNQIKDTEPSHPLKDYTGKFEHPAYGVIEITLRDDNLYAAFHGFETKLNHYHYDMFKTMTEEFAGLKLSFFSGSDGSINKVTTPLEQGVKEIEFDRIVKTKQLDNTTLSKYEGEYSIADMIITIKLNGNNLTMTVPGQPTYELTAVKDNEFNIKELNGYSVMFNTDESGKVTEILLIQPNGTFPAKKK